jgi:hypothetical protein
MDLRFPGLVRLKQQLFDAQVDERMMDRGSKVLDIAQISSCH